MNTRKPSVAGALTLIVLACGGLSGCYCGGPYSYGYGFSYNESPGCYDSCDYGYAPDYGCGYGGHGGYGYGHGYHGDYGGHYGSHGCRR